MFGVQSGQCVTGRIVHNIKIIQRNSHAMAYRHTPRIKVLHVRLIQFNCSIVLMFYIFQPLLVLMKENAFIDFTQIVLNVTQSL